MSLQSEAGSLMPSPTPVEPPSASETSLLGGLKLPGPIQALMDARKQQEWASWVDTQYNVCKNARLPFERQWFLNIAFTAGRQYLNPVNVPGYGFRLTAPKAPPWRVRIVVNKIRTAVRTECSKLTMNHPIPLVIPATTEDEDYTAARVAEKILKAEFATMTFDKEFKSYVWWGVVTGNSFLKSYWDPAEIDPDVQPPPQPAPFPGLPPMQTVVRGKIKYERINPFHIYVPDLLSEDLEKQPYVMHVTTRDPLWVKSAFGITATPDARAANTIMESAVLSPQNATNQHFDSVLVKEIWIKPNGHKDFPEGGVLTVVNGKCVQVQTKWPLPFAQYPFYKYDGIPTGGFYTESVVTDLIPLQKEYNRTKSQMIEIKNTMGKPKLLAQRGSINPRQISSEPGQAILYTPGFDKPDIIPAVGPDPSMGTELDRLSSDFDDISGQHEITRGNTPAQVTSGTAISFLQEQDDSKLSYQVSSIERCVQMLGTHYLKYAANYWNDERLIRIVGTDGAFEVVHWKKNAIKNNTDVRVQAGSALPESKAAKTAMLTEFMQNQWVAPETGMEMLGMNGYEKIIEDFLTDKRQAQRENLKLAEAPAEIMQTLMQPPVGPDGEPIMMPHPESNQMVPMDPITNQPWTPQPPLPVNSYDNHEAHIHFHNQFRKTQQFEMLDESIKQAFELHVQAHQLAMALPVTGAAGLPISPGSQPQGDPNAVPPGGEEQGQEQPIPPQ